MTIAIVGAGVAGLACAARLADTGLPAVLFDKGKRPGGRLSSLQLDAMVWDFGCPGIVPSAADFGAQAQRWMAEGILAPWPDGPPGTLVGSPAMSALIVAQSARCDVRYGMQVDAVSHHRDGWHLAGSGWREGPFSALVIAVPAEQAAALLSLHDLAMAREAAAVRSQPCWTAMVAFATGLPGSPAWLRDRGAVAWASRGMKPPQPGAPECWVIQATPAWSRQHIDASREAVTEAMIDALGAALGLTAPPPIFSKAHRWRFARVVGARAGAQWNADLRLGACGDWCLPGEVEGAWRSGRDLADCIALNAGALAESGARRASR